MNDKINTLINNLAQDIIELYEIKIPINNINEVAQKLGGTIEETTNISDSGIKKWNDRFVIYVPQLLSLKKRNFAIAHEIGHLFLHMGYSINQDIWNKQKKFNLL